MNAGWFINSIKPHKTRTGGLILVECDRSFLYMECVHSRDPLYTAQFNHVNDARTIIHLVIYENVKNCDLFLAVTSLLIKINLPNTFLILNYFKSLYRIYNRIQFIFLSRRMLSRFHFFAFEVVNNLISCVAKFFNMLINCNISSTIQFNYF